MSIRPMGLSPAQSVAAGAGTYATVATHGSTAGTARPTGAALVEWLGSVAPTNAVTGDRWWDTANELWKRYTGSAWVAAGAALSRTGKRANGGMVCFVGDDAYIGQYTGLLPAIEARGGRFTFAISGLYLDVASHMTTAQMLDAFNRGHEIACHTQDHIDMADSAYNSIDRAAQYAYKDTIEATIGAGNCRNYVAPYSTRNSGIDRELYSRFDNAFFGVNGKYIVPMDEAAPFQIGRFGGWLADADTTVAKHSRVLDLIRYAASHPVRVVIYMHEISNSAGMLTQTLVNEALDLCVSLGVPMVRLQDAFPRHHLLPDPTFEDATLRPWTGDGARVTAGPNGIVQTHALELSSTDSTTKSFASAVKVPAVGGRSFRYYAAIDTTITSGSGGPSLVLNEYDAEGTLLLSTLSTPITATAGWQWVSIDKVLLPSTVAVSVGGTLVGVVGSARFSTPWPSESYQQLRAAVSLAAPSVSGGLPQNFDRAGFSKANAISGSHTFSFPTTVNSTAPIPPRGGYRLLPAAGDYAEWTAVLQAGTYTLEVEVYKATSGGTLTVTIGGGSAGADIDTYAAALASVRVENAGIVIPADGQYTIRFAVAATKNASSGGFQSRLSGFSLARTGA